MKRRYFFAALFAAAFSILPVPASAAEPPRLVVVVSIDQFPYEYLERMRPGFRPEGIFLRMCDDGANFTNCQHGHAFTITAPGHSVQLTGGLPKPQRHHQQRMVRPGRDRGRQTGADVLRRRSSRRDRRSDRPRRRTLAEESARRHSGGRA